MITLLLVDDQKVVRQGLRMRLALEPDLEVVGEASDGAAAVDMARQHTPNLVLMDLEMPVMDGLTATAALRAEMPDTAVVILSIHEDRLTRERARAAGAAAFVAKHEGAEALLRALRAAAGHPESD